MRVIGLTGGIGAGKSTVVEFFRQRGAIIIDADVLARELMLPGSAVLASVVEAFGEIILLPDGSLDRSELAHIVFADTTARQKLEALTHPAIIAETFRQVEAYLTQPLPPAVVLVVAPLLFETGMEDKVEKVIVVYAQAETRIARLHERDGLSESEIRARFIAQISPEEQLKRADWVIDNSGELAATEAAVENVWQELTAAPS